MTDFPVLLGENEVAARLHLQPSTVRTWRLDGSGPPFIKVGRRVLYREADLVEWINSRVRGSTSEYERYSGKPNLPNRNEAIRVLVERALNAENERNEDV
jgi:predicted DNA-binding transcriptional regulator AlpA